ncbi:MAG TPA: methionyl-tRNA formyltransferase [Candidatus Dormibacteraeota bacterium]|nr:methionyl-tRNA formyltransferase [Candidatus Dormibacteraeota bacterium]
MSKTVVFFGSGPVAAESLALLATDFVIEAVVTKPRPLHHKTDYPVLLVAKKLGIKSYTPNNKQQLSDLFKTKPTSSQIGVVIDYGIIISRDVIDYFAQGIINSHFSLLPEWRGADPISAAILSGQTLTGVSLMLINEKLDEGPLLAQKELKIKPTETALQLTSSLIELSHQMLVETVPLYSSGQLKPADQLRATISKTKIATYSRKLTKDDGLLDWYKPAAILERQIRAFIDWPKSRCQIAKQEIIVTQAKVIPGNGQAGTVQVIGKRLLVATAKDWLEIERLKPISKPEMSAQAFLAGYKDLLTS